MRTSAPSRRPSLAGLDAAQLAAASAIDVDHALRAASRRASSGRSAWCRRPGIAIGASQTAWLRRGIGRGLHRSRAVCRRASIGTGAWLSLSIRIAAWPASPRPRCWDRRRSGTGCRSYIRESSASLPAWPSLTQADGRHDLPGRAVAALEGVVIDEGLLHRMQLAVRLARPSIVVTSRPWTLAASVRQDSTRRPSISTVQAPHWPWSQPFLPPVSPRCSRNASSRWCARRARGDAPAVDPQREAHWIAGPSPASAPARRRR